MFEHLLCLQPRQFEFFKTSFDLDIFYKKVEEAHVCLKIHDIQLPTLRSLNGKTLAILMWGLYNHTVFDKGMLTDIVRNLGHPDLNDLQAPRHLSSQLGWDIRKDSDIVEKNLNIISKKNEDYHKNGKMKKGYFYLSSTTEKYQNWSPDGRKNNIIKNKNPGYCETCFCKEGYSHPSGNGTVRIEKGHKDRLFSLGDDNIVWQCQFCNTNLKDFNLNNHGVPIALANTKPFISSSHSMQCNCVAFFLNKHKILLNDLPKNLFELIKPYY